MIVSGGKTITSSAQIAPDVIVDSDINSAAAISQSKLNLAITNAEIAAGAAIVDTKLATISTAGKVDGAALTLLANIPAGAGVIPAANVPVPAGDLNVFVPGGAAAVNAAGPTIAMSFSRPAVIFNNSADGQQAAFSAKVPKTGVSISAIEVFYIRGSTGNVRLTFPTNQLDYSAVPVATTFDTTDTVASYAGGASDNSNGKITVPAAAYDGLTPAEDDIITLLIERTATDVSDTYETTFIVTGVLFKFA